MHLCYWPLVALERCGPKYLEFNFIHLLVFAVLSRPSSPVLGPGLSGDGGGGSYDGGHLVEDDPAVQFVTNCLSDNRCARQMRAEAGMLFVQLFLIKLTLRP